MNNIDTLEEFLEKMGPMFHTRLMMLHEAQVKDEYRQDDDTVIHFTFPQGEYSIRLGLLKERADNETLQLLDDNGLEMIMGPLPKNGKRIVKKGVQDDNEYTV